MSRRHAPLVAAAALLLLAAAASLLSFESWRWQSHVGAEDRRLAQAVVPADTWAERGAVSAAVLGAADDTAFRRALAHFRRGRSEFAGGEKTIEEIVSSVEAGLALGEIARGSQSAARRSAALNLQAILTGETAVLETDAQTRIRVASEQLRRAIRLDPASDAAKANLELLLRLTGEAGAPFDATGGFGGYGEDAAAGAAGGGY